MAQRAPTRYTNPDEGPFIHAEDDAQIYRGIFGGSGIAEGDQKLACTAVDGSTVRLSPGTFVNQGYIVCVPGGSYEDLTIEAGTLGMYRKDLIVAEFVRGGDEVSDQHVIKVLRGTTAASEAAAQPPTLVQNDLSAGGSFRQEPIYLVLLNGTTIASIVRVADFVGNYYR